MKTFELQTSLGRIRGIDDGDHLEYRGIKFASCDRFSYAKPLDTYSSSDTDRMDENGVYDATKNGPACTQKRVWHEHLEIPERGFYHKEFREGIHFDYAEDCLYLNVFTPRPAKDLPVIVFIHGGGFDSGACYDTALDGGTLCEKSAIVVSIQYRVGVFGYFTHPQIQKELGRNGNFGLDDQFVALHWIKDHISDFGGDPENITLMGQSAGAISIQYLCLSEKCKGLFRRVIMMSGGGMFPKFALPRPSSQTTEYWQDVMQEAGAKDFSAFQTMDAKEIFDALERVKARRKDNTYNTMPVIDGYLIRRPVDDLINDPLPIDYMIGYTNNDMYAYIMAYIGHKFAAQVKGYLYYFDIDAPGDDNNGAFHSCDIRYMFGTLKTSHRPYSPEDEKISDLMMDYVISYAKTGDPNHPGAPLWQRGGKKALHITRDISHIAMCKKDSFKLLKNMLTKGDPK